MNIKTINQLEETNNIDGFYGIACDDNNETKKYELPPIMKGICQKTTSIGGDNIVGLKGYYYKAINFETNTLYLTAEQTTPSLGEVGTENITCGYAVGDIISIINNSKYDNCSTITEIGVGYIVVNAFPFTVLDTELDFSAEDFSVYCLSKPDIGISDLGYNSLAVGVVNSVTNGSAVAFGCANHSYGKFSFCTGRDNSAGYSAQAMGWGNTSIGYASHAEGYTTTAGEPNGGRGAHAEGLYTVAIKNGSHAEGQYTQATAGGAHAEGLYTVATARGAHAEGLYTIANTQGCHACGKWNLPHDNTIFSIGVGKEGTEENPDINRKNAFEVLTTGEVKIENGDLKIPNNKISAKQIQVSESANITGDLSVNGNTVLGDKATPTTDDNGNITVPADEVTVRANLTVNGKTTLGNSSVDLIKMVGNIYIYGLGGYNGNNASTSTNLVSYIQSLENRILALENK